LNLADDSVDLLF